MAKNLTKVTFLSVLFVVAFNDSKLRPVVFAFACLKGIFNKVLCSSSKLDHQSSASCTLIKFLSVLFF